MGHAEVIALSEARASKQWASLRHQLHDYFDEWLDDLQAQLPEPETTLAEITETVWALRQNLTGSLTEALVEHAHDIEYARRQIVCTTCQRILTARPFVARTVETMVGNVRIERPYFYCRVCREGVSPLDEILGLTPGRKQLDVQKAAAKVAIDMPYEEAQRQFHDLTGVSIDSERMHTLTNQVAQGLTVLDVAPSREEIEQRITEVAAGKWRRPVVVLGIDGAFVPTRPKSARGRRPGQRRYRAKRPQWKGVWRDAKGFRFYLIDEDRIVHLISWHQVMSGVGLTFQNEADLGEALKQIKEAGLIPEDQIRLCVLCDGASGFDHVVGQLTPIWPCQPLDVGARHAVPLQAADAMIEAGRRGYGNTSRCCFPRPVRCSTITIVRNISIGWPRRNIAYQSRLTNGLKLP